MSIKITKVDILSTLVYNAAMGFGKLLSKLRQKQKIPQKELAGILGLDPTYLSKIENGKRSPLSRDVVIEIARALDLNETDTDELLISANYQPQTLFDLGFDTNDLSLKKHIGVLRDIKNKAPLASYIKAKEEITGYLDLMRSKYTSEIDEDLVKNTLLADYIYSKVRRGGLKALYREMRRPLGGAIVMYKGKLLLHQIGISPVKGWWHIPIGFVNPQKGDKTSRDIAVRLVKRYLGNVSLEVGKEITADGEPLGEIETPDYFVKLGLFPSPVQIYEVKIRSNRKIKVAPGADFFKVSELPKIKGDIHPFMHEIVKYYFKNSKVAKALYQRGEEAIEHVLMKKNYYEDMKRFEGQRIKIKQK